MQQKVSKMLLKRLDMTLLCRSLLLSVLLSAMAGCGWFSADEEIQPATLVDINAENQVRTSWSYSSASLGSKFHALRPALLGNRVYLVDAKGGLYAVDGDTGKTIWKVALDAAIIGGVGAGDGKIMVTTDDGLLLVHSALDGAFLWMFNLNAESLSPAQANSELVLVQSIDGVLRGLSASTGEQAWSYKADLPALTLRGESTPILLDKAVFAGFANGKVVAIDPKSGNVAWEQRVALPQGKTELERVVDVDGQLVLDAGKIYATSYQGRLVVLQASNGRTLWSKDLSSYRSVTDGGNALIAVDDQGHILAFDKNTGLELWRQEGLFFRQPTNPVMVSGRIAVADYQGYVHFLAPEDGRFVARSQVNSSGIKGPIKAESDKLYVYGNNGRLSVLILE